MSVTSSSRALWLTALLTLPLGFSQPATAGGQSVPESPAQVRQLFEAADYEGALAAAGRTDTARLAPSAARDVQVYEALCLLALGKETDAERRIETVLRAEPGYAPGDDLPNRLKGVVTRVRNRLARELVNSHLATGREMVAAGRHQEAIAELELALQVTELVPEAALPQRDDFRTLAAGFKDLATKAAAREATGVAVPTNAEVVAPAAVRQDLPPWPEAPGAKKSRQAATRGMTGVLEVVISNAGTVKSAKLLDDIDPNYDPILITAAMDWQYLPATRGGLPIEYVKRLTIRVR